MDLAELLTKLGSVFALAFFSFWASIPMGIALGLSPVLVGATAWGSYTTGVLLFATLGGPLRARLLKRLGNRVNANSPIRRAWNRYGLLGLSLLAPATTGSQIGTVIGLALGAPKRRLVIGMTLGALPWAVGLTLAVVLGVMVVRPG